MGIRCEIYAQGVVQKIEWILNIYALQSRNFIIIQSSSIARKSLIGIPLTIDHVLRYPSCDYSLFSFCSVISLSLLCILQWPPPLSFSTRMTRRFFLRSHRRLPLHRFFYLPVSWTSMLSWRFLLLLFPQGGK